MKIHIGKELTWAFALALLLIIVGATLSFRDTHILIENQDWVLRTHDALTQLEKISAAVKDAESGERNYLITGDETYLTPYHEARGGIDEQIRRFEALTADHPLQRERLPRLTQEITQRLDILQKNFELRRDKGEQAARQHVLAGSGRRQMREVAELIRELEAEQRLFLEHRTEESRASGQELILTFAFSNLLSLALLTALYYFVHRDTSAGARVQADSHAAQDELEMRVEQRTAQLVDAGVKMRSEIEERRRAEERLKAAVVELDRSNRELQDFAFVASHDLQEPLRKIRAFGNRLQVKCADALSPEGRDYLERMQSAARRMHDLINDLLTLSRITSKTQPFAAVDLGQMAREVVEDLDARIEETGGRVSIGSLPTIEADPVHMRQMLQNLLANGLKFHRQDAPPVVTITSEIVNDQGSRPEDNPHDDRPDGLCRLAVEDNGIGFDEQYLDRIFTPFQRLHPRGEYEGTGMGLAVCRKIVERHGGSITARSVPGQGATFLVTLPLRQNHGQGTQSL